MGLHLLGTAGGPVWYPRTDRVGTSTAISVGDAVYLFDLGDGALRRYREAGLGRDDVDFAGFEQLRAVFLTHLHPDHYADLIGLYLFAPVMGLARGANQPVQLVGPGARSVLPPQDPRVPEGPVLSPENPTPGLVDLVDALLSGNAATLNESIRDTGRADPRLQIAPREVELPGDLAVSPNTDPAPPMDPFLVYEDDRVQVTAILVPHGATFPSFAYRIDADEGSVVVSGDTSASDNVKRLGQGADVLVHEVVDERWANSIFPEPFSPRHQALVDKIVNAHTPVSQVGAVAEEAGVRDLVLSHLSPANLPSGRWRSQVQGFRGRVTTGSDLDHHRIG